MKLFQMSRTTRLLILAATLLIIASSSSLVQGENYDYDDYADDAAYGEGSGFYDYKEGSTQTHQYHSINEATTNKTKTVVQTSFDNLNVQKKDDYQYDDNYDYKYDYDEDDYNDQDDPKADATEKLDTFESDKKPDEIILPSKSTTVEQITYQSTRSKLFAIISKPGILAGIVGGAVIGILTAVLLIMFIVYRMRKKDEGSYALEETKKPLSAYDYRNCPTKEFYA